MTSSSSHRGGDPVELLVAALEAADCAPKGDAKGTARCPAHDDQTPSLTWRRAEDGKALVKCHTGCTFEGILDALRLEPRDMFMPDKDGSGGSPRRPKVVSKREYQIRDMDGVVKAVHVRQELENGSKKFLWRLPNGVWGLGGLPGRALPLYGVERIAARPTDEVVFVEGEKAADALLSRGLLAVGSVTGADKKGKRPGDAPLSALKGRNVVLWPDADDPGRNHMNAIGKALQGVAASVRVVEWREAPEAGDAADFVGTDDDLKKLIAAGVDFPGYLAGAVSGKEQRVEAATATTSKGSTDDTADDVARDELTTDLGNARRLVKLFGKDLRWTKGFGDMVWEGARWVIDKTGAAIRLAKKAVRSILDEARDLGRRGPEFKEKAEKRFAWAMHSQLASRITAALELARTEPEIACEEAAFDGDIYTLNVANGTLDLKTMTLREHRREDLLTKITRAGYDAAATAPMFTKFLERILPDPEVRGYVQRFLGSALTGCTGDQILVFFYGEGANGKSTLTELIAWVLSEYAAHTPFATLTAKRDNPTAASPDLAALVGTRLVLATEPAEGAKLNISLIKQLTGCEIITARNLYKGLFSYFPQFKILLVGNNRPEITETTHAAWRRVHLVPFDVRIPENERNPQLLEKLKSERDGILQWLAEGCRDWMAGGLRPPAAVLAATEEYRKEEDPLRDFVQERCVLGAACFARADTLYTAFKEFRKAIGVVPESQKWFGHRLGLMGLTRSKSGTVVWHGIGLRPKDDPQGPDAPDDPPGGGGASNGLDHPDHSGPNPKSSPESVFLGGVSGNGSASSTWSGAPSRDSEDDPARWSRFVLVPKCVCCGQRDFWVAAIGGDPRCRNCYPPAPGAEAVPREAVEPSSSASAEGAPTPSPTSPSTPAADSPATPAGTSATPAGTSATPDTAYPATSNPDAVTTCPTCGAPASAAHKCPATTSGASGGGEASS